MSGVAQLKAGPTQEQQHHAQVLRECLLADLQEQVWAYTTISCGTAPHHAVRMCNQVLFASKSCSRLRSKQVLVMRCIRICCTALLYITHLLDVSFA